MNTKQDHIPAISLTVLATLCFVTLVMSQTRFRISKEISPEVYPPILRSKDCWFLYTIGNPDRFKCVLRAFVVITSPVISFISTALLLFGKIESNPYFFIPWLFLTLKGLVLIQTDNLITILRDMSTKTNYAWGFRIEDFKWILFYFTIFVIDLVEAFSFCEIFDLFLVLWNHNTKCKFESANFEEMKKEIADVMNSLSKCSLGSLSKISLGSTSDSDGVNDTNVKELESSLKLATREDEKLFEVNEQLTLSKGDGTVKGELQQNVIKKTQEGNFKGTRHFGILKPALGDEAIAVVSNDKDKGTQAGDGDIHEPDKSNTKNVKLNTFPNTEGREKSKIKGECGRLINNDMHKNVVTKQEFPINTACS